MRAEKRSNPRKAKVMHNCNNRAVDLIDVDRLIRRAFESATTTAPETLRKWHQAEVTAKARAKKEASKNGD